MSVTGEKAARTDVAASMDSGVDAAAPLHGHAASAVTSLAKGRMVTPGVRLHDLPAGSVEDRIRMAANLGFRCIQLPSKVLYSSYGIDRSGLTPELAARLRDVLDEAGMRVAVLGCYKNLATPDAAQLADNLAEYDACFAFANLLGGCPVGTETGRPNAANKVADDRFAPEALDAFCEGLMRAVALARARGARLLIEPGWNEVVCTPERCRTVLERVRSSALGVIYDPVSLLHPRVAAPEAAQAEVSRMLDLVGERIEVLHAKDFELMDVEGDEDGMGWCDGSGKRLVCHGVGATGGFDFTPVRDWAARTHPGIPIVVENGTPSTFAHSLEVLTGSETLI